VATTNWRAMGVRRYSPLYKREALVLGRFAEGGSVVSPGGGEAADADAQRGRLGQEGKAQVGREAIRGGHDRAGQDDDAVAEGGLGKLAGVSGR
jgi:hypothetical protein